MPAGVKQTDRLFSGLEPEELEALIAQQRAVLARLPPGPESELGRDLATTMLEALERELARKRAAGR